MRQSPKIVLHGGMHKTGTTALQVHLAEARELLLRHGIFYPDTGAPHHDNILSSWRHDWTADGLLKQINLARDVKADVILLSAETVSVLTPPQVRRIWCHLERHEVAVVFAFRHWCDYWPSRWAQYAQRRDAQSFQEYLDGLTSIYSTHVDADFGSVISKFHTFSNTTVHAVSYDYAVASGRSVLHETLLAMGLPSSLITQVTASEKTINQRKNWLEVEKIRLLNGALSEFRQANPDSLFQSTSGFACREPAYDLAKHIPELEREAINQLEGEIKDAKVEIELSSDDATTRHLLARFENTSAQHFTNSQNGQLFPRNLCSTCHCTNLKPHDVIGKELVTHLAELTR